MCTRRVLEGLEGERAWVGPLAAGRAVHPGLEGLAAAVLVDGRERLTGHVPVTPLPERHDHGQQVAAGVGEPVLVPRWPAGILRALDDARVLQPAQPRGEDVARRAGVDGNLAEPPYAEEQLADHEQGPLLADDVEGAGNRAVAGVGDS
jgi:hypothetical protein